MEKKSYKLIAEIGASHAGSVSRAIMLTEMAADSGADIVKFQKRDPVSSTSAAIAGEPHPSPFFSYGKTYLEHRIALELSIREHETIKNRCEKLGVKYSCSAWDIKSASDLMLIDPFFIKIPSACNLNNNLIEFCLGKSNSIIHISLGMLGSSQRLEVMNKYKDRGVIFYHTTTEYPCPFDRLYLKEIETIISVCGDAGFSNHGYGIASDIAAMTLGASYIERHFIDDRTFRHTDAAASIEPSGMKTLKRDLDNISLALSFNKKETCTPQELINSIKLRNSSF